MPDCTFFVEGKPATQGSKRLVRRGRKVMMIEASRRIMPWREKVAYCARRAGLQMIDGDVQISIVALWDRPKAHFRKNGTIRDSAPSRPGYADCDKVCRGICDALAGIAYANDRSVATLCIERRWARDGESGGALISVCAASSDGFWQFVGANHSPAQA